MGFWAGAAAVIVLVVIAVVLLYALALWWSVREESFISTVWGVVRQVATGDFW